MAFRFTNWEMLVHLAKTGKPLLQVSACGHRLMCPQPKAAPAKLRALLRQTFICNCDACISACRQCGQSQISDSCLREGMRSIQQWGWKMSPAVNLEALADCFWGTDSTWNVNTAVFEFYVEQCNATSSEREFRGESFRPRFWISLWIGRASQGSSDPQDGGFKMQTNGLHCSLLYLGDMAESDSDCLIDFLVSLSRSFHRNGELPCLAGGDWRFSTDVGPTRASFATGNPIGTCSSCSKCGQCAQFRINAPAARPWKNILDTHKHAQDIHSPGIVWMEAREQTTSGVYGGDYASLRIGPQRQSGVLHHAEGNRCMIFNTCRSIQKAVELKFPTYFEDPAWPRHVVSNLHATVKEVYINLDMPNDREGIRRHHEDQLRQYHDKQRIAAQLSQELVTTSFKA